MNLFELVKQASIKVDGIQKTPRTDYSVLSSAMSELGELAEEIAISNGNHYKSADVDGVVGEIVDVLVTLLDLLHVHDKTITEEYIVSYAEKKLNKWVTKVEQNENIKDF
jgi:NTP pyrophosphatase (non-canonical NTP hydrolase)